MSDRALVWVYIMIAIGVALLATAIAEQSFITGIS